MKDYREASFDWRFARVEGGYLYYPYRWSRGFLVTVEEYEAARENHILQSHDTLFYVILLMMGIALFGASFAGLASGEPWIFGLAVLIVGGTIGYMIWRDRALLRQIRGRAPVAPRRSKREWDEAYAANFSWNIILWPWAYFLLLLLTRPQRLQDMPAEEPVFTVILAVIVVTGLYSFPGIVLAKLRQRRGRECHNA